MIMASWMIEEPCRVCHAERNQPCIDIDGGTHVGREASKAGLPDVCPTCGAQPGEDCVTLTNRRATGTHATRHPSAPYIGWQVGGPLRLAYEAEEREHQEWRRQEAEMIARDTVTWAARLAAVLPPFTPEQIAEVARLVATIDARRNKR